MIKQILLISLILILMYLDFIFIILCRHFSILASFSNLKFTLHFLNFYFLVEQLTLKFFYLFSQLYLFMLGYFFLILFFFILQIQVNLHIIYLIILYYLNFFFLSINFHLSNFKLSLKVFKQFNFILIIINLFKISNL